MKLIRPIQTTDLEALSKLLKQTTYGLTSLPKNPELLKDRVQDSISSFSKKSRTPGGESYLFAMEDMDHGRLAGICGIVSKVGGFEPWYTYQIIETERSSRLLKVNKKVKALHLVSDHDGPCEIGSLFLAPTYRAKGMGRFLSLARFLFMADNKSLFDPVVIAEMRGVIDKRGHSPFWDSLGKNFFEIDFPRADNLSLVNKKFIADLMPEHPIYLPLLSSRAQEVIGDVHPKTRPALKILEAEGFKKCDMIDIFEGGPVVKCALKNIRSIKESAKMEITSIADTAPKSVPYIISNARLDFRACLAPLKIQAKTRKLTISREVALALKVKVGDTLRFVALHPRKRRSRKV